MIGMGDLAKFQGESITSSTAHADSDQADYSESNYDEFSGYSGERLFSTNYEEDDVEADQIYSKVDEAMYELFEASHYYILDLSLADGI